MSSPPAVVHVFETNRGIQSLAIRVSLVHQESNTRQMHRVCLFLRSQNQPSGNALSAIFGQHSSVMAIIIRSAISGACSLVAHCIFGLGKV